MRRWTRNSSDEGSSLLMAAAVVAIAMALGIAVVTGVLATNRRAAVDTQRTAALAAAEAGVDLVTARLQANVTTGAANPCTGADAAVPDVVAGRAKYTVAVTVSCDMAANPATATVTARARAAATLAGGTTYGERTLQSTVTFSGAGDAATTPFTSGVFSNGPVMTNNSLVVNNASLTSKSDVKCINQGFIGGDIIAGGSVYLTNDCSVQGDVRAGGNYSCDTKGEVQGSVTAAGTGPSGLQNSCSVGGALASGGSLTVNGNTKIHGDLTSATGDIVFPTNSPRITGNARAAGTITYQSGGSTKSVVAGSVLPNSPSAVPAAPTIANMPHITWAMLTGATPAPAVVEWKKWLQENARRNNAPTWTGSYLGTSCKGDGAGYELNGNLVSTATAPVILDARACTKAELQNVTVSLKGDVTLVVNQFATNGTVTVKSADGAPHNFRLVALSSGAGDPCATPSAQSLSFSNTMTFDAKTSTFIYTPGTLTVSNAFSMTGSIYACATSFSNSVTINYADVAPPGTGSPAAPSTVTVTQKREVSGA